jgi:hypothetical protein
VQYDGTAQGTACGCIRDRPARPALPLAGCLGHTAHAASAPPLTCLSSPMLPSTFLTAPVALSLLLPLCFAATPWRRATTCNGFSDVCAHIRNSRLRTHLWVYSFAEEATAISPLSVRMTRTLSGSTTVSLHECLGDMTF